MQQCLFLRQNFFYNAHDDFSPGSPAASSTRLKKCDDIGDLTSSLAFLRISDVSEVALNLKMVL
jgi:hypothetical protein